MSFTPKTPVSVSLSFDVSTGKVIPTKLMYRGSTYLVEKLGFHHYFREGRTLYHVFSVTSGKVFFKLVLNTDNLNWILEEVYDAELNE